MTITTHIYSTPRQTVCGKLDRQMVKAEWVQYKGVIYEGEQPSKPCRRCNQILEGHQVARENLLNGRG